MKYVIGFIAGFALAWWYRPKWMLKRLKEYVAREEGIG